MQIIKWIFLWRKKQNRREIIVFSFSVHGKIIYVYLFHTDASVKTHSYLYIKKNAFSSDWFWEIDSESM